MPHPVSDAFIERALNRAVEVGALHAWSPAKTRDPAYMGRTDGPRRRWYLAFPDGTTKVMPAGAVWGFCLGVIHTANASTEAAHATVR